MTTLDKHQSRTRTKMLVVGEQGTGKTSLLASLVNNYNQTLFILDYDDGLDNLYNLVDPDKRHKVHFKTLRDKIMFDPATGAPKPKGRPTAFVEGVKATDKWIENGEDLGNIYTWGPDVTIVIDGITHMGTAAMNYTLALNKRLGKAKRQKDWGDAIEKQEGFIAMLCADEVRCNVVIMAHLKRLRVSKYDEDNTDAKDEKEKESILTYRRYPSALGQGLPPNVGTYFNVVVQAKTKGGGTATSYVLATQPDRDVAVKVPVDQGDKLKLGRELPNETALATLFEMLQQH